MYTAMGTCKWVIIATTSAFRPHATFIVAVIIIINVQHVYQEPTLTLQNTFLTEFLNTSRHRYQGSFLAGKRHGQGSYNFKAMVCQLVGNWIEGGFVRGRWVMKDGSMFYGSFHKQVAPVRTSECTCKVLQHVYLLHVCTLSACLKYRVPATSCLCLYLSGCASHCIL